MDVHMILIIYELLIQNRSENDWIKNRSESYISLVNLLRKLNSISASVLTEPDVYPAFVGGFQVGLE